MANPDFYKKCEDIAGVTARLKELDKQLETAYSRWQILEGLQA
jgi:hypothetical protein